MRRAACRGLVLLAGLLAVAADASAFAVRMRWAASADPAVAGYRVYTRPATADWRAPEDVGLPAAAADGTLGWVVSDLDPETDWVFAVAAYRADGMASPLSNQLFLPARRARACAADADCADANACTANERCVAGRCASDAVGCPGGPCADGVCDPFTGCHVVARPEQSACYAGDPCAPGVCTASACIVPAAVLAATTTHALVVHRFVVRRAGRRGRLAARASFAPASALDPTRTGVALEVRADDGRLLLQHAVPADAIRGDRRGRLFRFAAPPPRRRGAGLTRLVLRVADGVVDVDVRARTDEPPASWRDRPVAWMLRLAEECARDVGLACSGRRPAAVRCR
jgi:hypothetical protein